MDKKIIALIFVFTFAVIGIAIIVFSSGSSKAELQKTKGAKLQTQEDLLISMSEITYFSILYSL